MDGAGGAVQEVIKIEDDVSELEPPKEDRCPTTPGVASICPGTAVTFSQSFGVSPSLAGGHGLWATGRLHAPPTGEIDLDGGEIAPDSDKAHRP